MLHHRLLAVAGCGLLCLASCGGRDSVRTVEDDSGIAVGPQGGFRATNTEEPFSGTGAWDFGVLTDGPLGKPCDPEQPDFCGADLLCCRASRELQVCTQPIRTGECPKVPNGPSGGKATNKDPGRPPS